MIEARLFESLVIRVTIVADPHYFLFRDSLALWLSLYYKSGNVIKVTFCQRPVPESYVDLLSPLQDQNFT